MSVDYLNPIIVNEVANQIYDFCCCERHDNPEPTNARRIGCEFSELFEESKLHYRDIARWHLKQIKENV